MCITAAVGDDETLMVEANDDEDNADSEIFSDASSSATEDAYNDEPDHVTFTMAEDLSEEVCELQLQNELLMGRNQQLQKEISLLKNQLHHSSEYSMAINDVYEMTVSDNMKLAILKKSYQFTADFINKDGAKTILYWSSI